jgi:hypothetical protein
MASCTRVGEDQPVVVADARREPAGPLHGVPFALAAAPVVEDAPGGRLA